ncbi:hypothetical protein GQ44DRAFT_604623 [Phaeosphaeriaceae sp. PMI808]|nr:hypothetical protein GQ44DRAFT_604623 [Phaeosphaeriaceae sp. PMI808]
MAATSMQAAALPRFLLPQLSWSTKAIKPVAFGSPELWRHRPSAAFKRYSTAPVATTLQQQSLQQWRRGSPHSTACRISPLESRRQFSATAAQKKDHHFDTLKLVQRLKDEGFTEQQAEGMMRILSDVIEESIQNLTRTMVLREDQEKATYTQKVDFAKLRSELTTADSTESSLTRASHERLTNELAKLNSRLRDEIQRTQASVRLDLNLEKGRIREEANAQELKLKETETRIESETAALRERLEAVKFSTLQWLMGVCTGTAALMLGVWRLLM